MRVKLKNKKTGQEISRSPVDAREILAYDEWERIGDEGFVPYETENKKSVAMPTQIAKEEEKVLKKRMKKKVD